MADQKTITIKVLENKGQFSAEAGTTTTNVTITDHGLVTGDFMINITRRATTQSSGERGSRRITRVDDDNFTVTAITGQTTADEIILLGFTDRSSLIKAKTLSYSKRAEGEDNLSFTAMLNSNYFEVIYIYAIYGQGVGDLSDVDEYTISDDTWSAKGAGTSPARDQLAACVVNEKGYAFCGEAASTVLQDTDEYVNSTDTWSNKTNCPSPARRELAASEAISLCFILHGYSTTTLKDVDSFNANNDSWTSKTDASVFRESIKTTNCNDKVIAAYGFYVGSRFNTTNQYDPSADSWSTKTAAPTPARYNTVAYEISEKGYFVGGVGAVSANSYADNDEYDQSTDSWTSKTDLPLISSYGRFSAAGSSTNEKGFIHGGVSNVTVIQNHTEWDEASDVWTEKTTLSSPARQDHESLSLA